MRNPSRRFRWAITAVAIVLTGAVAAVVMTRTSSESHGRGRQSLSKLLARVQRSFGDGRLLAATADGSRLTVTVAATDEPSRVSAGFEGEMLAAAARDSLSTEDGPIGSVRMADADGRPVGREPVGDRNFPALADGACKSAAQAAQRTFKSFPAHPSMRVESVLTLPYAGGSCAFKFQTSDPEAFAEAAPSVIPPLDEAMGEPNRRSFLLQVDDQEGTPQFVYSYLWSGGRAHGSTYIKPDLSQMFGL